MSARICGEAPPISPAMTTAGITRRRLDQGEVQEHHGRRAGARPRWRRGAGRLRIAPEHRPSAAQIFATAVERSSSSGESTPQIDSGRSVERLAEGGVVGADVDEEDRRVARPRSSGTGCTTPCASARRPARPPPVFSKRIDLRVGILLGVRPDDALADVIRQVGPRDPDHRVAPVVRRCPSSGRNRSWTRAAPRSGSRARRGRSSATPMRL